MSNSHGGDIQLTVWAMPSKGRVAAPYSAAAPPAVHLRVRSTLLQVSKFKALLKTAGKSVRGDESLYAHGELMDDAKLLQDYGVRHGSAILAVPCHTSSAYDTSSALYASGPLPLTENMERTLKLARAAMENGQAPKLTTDGTGATYFLKSAEQTTLLCFKPQDEEQYAPYNPRGSVGELGQATNRAGFLSGEGFQREVAAFLLDYDGFVGVPDTCLAVARHPKLSNDAAGPPHAKVGSLQQFSNFKECLENFGKAQYSVEELQKIAVLDMRLLNTDRHPGNVLVHRQEDGQLKLVPIDHGLSLPDMLQVDWFAWEWLSYPQLKAPVTASVREYVAKLDIDADAKLLEAALGIRPGCLLTMRIAGHALQRGVAAGMTLFDIGKALSRQIDLSCPSLAENLVLQALAKARQDVKQSRHFVTAGTAQHAPVRPMPRLPPPAASTSLSVPDPSPATSSRQAAVSIDTAMPGASHTPGSAGSTPSTTSRAPTTLAGSGFGSAGESVHPSSHALPSAGASLASSSELAGWHSAPVDPRHTPLSTVSSMMVDGSAGPLYKPTLVPAPTMLITQVKPMVQAAAERACLTAAAIPHRQGPQVSSRVVSVDMLFGCVKRTIRASGMYMCLSFALTQDAALFDQEPLSNEVCCTAVAAAVGWAGVIGCSLLTLRNKDTGFYTEGGVQSAIPVVAAAALGTLLPVPLTKAGEPTAAVHPAPDAHMPLDNYMQLAMASDESTGLPRSLSDGPGKPRTLADEFAHHMNPHVHDKNTDILRAYAPSLALADSPADEALSTSGSVRGSVSETPLSTGSTPIFGPDGDPVPRTLHHTLQLADARRVLTTDTNLRDLAKVRKPRSTSLSFGRDGPAKRKQARGHSHTAGPQSERLAPAAPPLHLLQALKGAGALDMSPAASSFSSLHPAANSPPPPAAAGISLAPPYIRLPPAQPSLTRQTSIVSLQQTAAVSGLDRQALPSVDVRFASSNTQLQVPSPVAEASDRLVGPSPTAGALGPGPLPATGSSPASHEAPDDAVGIEPPVQRAPASVGHVLVRRVSSLGHQPDETGAETPAPSPTASPVAGDAAMVDVVVGTMGPIALGDRNGNPSVSVMNARRLGEQLGKQVLRQAGASHAQPIVGQAPAAAVAAAAAAAVSAGTTGQMPGALGGALRRTGKLDDAPCPAVPFLDELSEAVQLTAIAAQSRASSTPTSILDALSEATDTVATSQPESCHSSTAGSAIAAPDGDAPQSAGASSSISATHAGIVSGPASAVPPQPAIRMPLSLTRVSSYAPGSTLSSLAALSPTSTGGFKQLQALVGAAGPSQAPARALTLSGGSAMSQRRARTAQPHDAIPGRDNGDDPETSAFFEHFFALWERARIAPRPGR